MNNSAQLINQDSGVVEYYTPKFIVDAARAVMGGIDLDPASCELANTPVQATNIFTKEDDGLMRAWVGRVWMNHPFERGRNHLWINKLVSEYGLGSVTQAVCICYASTSEKWFRPLLDFPQCFLHKRVNYLDEHGNEKRGVTKGSVVTFLGCDLGSVKREFSRHGTIKVKA
jgi:hypothetical protein